MFEFLLSMFILAGGGFLLYRGIASELASGVITLIVGYWFTKRSNESAVNNLLRQSPTMVPILTPPVEHPAPQEGSATTNGQ